jgi:hypothetical protein
MKPSAISVAAWVGTFVVGCASSMPPPTDQWAAAQADVGRAQEGGAPQVPEARLHLQLAVEDLQKSHELMGRDNERSTTLCALARTEAHLALSLTKQASAQDAALKAQGDLQAGGVKPTTPLPTGATNVMPPSSPPAPAVPRGTPGPNMGPGLK